MARFWNMALGLFGLFFFLACLGYVVWRSAKNSEDPARLVFKWILTVVILIGAFFFVRQFSPPYRPLIAVVFAIPIGIIWTASIGGFLAAPLAGMFDGGNTEPDKKPMYSYAEARRRKGMPIEAIAEIRKVLANFPGDFTGVLLLASIQAEDLKDLPAAEDTLEEFIAQPKLPPQAIFGALQNLADLQWRHGKGAAAATETLQRITRAFPDTPLAHSALQRIAHLEAADHTRQQRAQAHFTVPTGERDIGLRVGFNSPPKAASPAEEMDRLIHQLELHPADVETREQLAMLYAGELGRVDLAAEQLEQLIALRAESPRHIGHWLNLLATVHARFGNDLPGAESALRRILERFPASTMAEAAVTRLASLNSEVKANQQTEAKTLGSYEKQIGLKKI